MSLDKIAAAKKASFIDFAYDMFQPGVLQPPVDPGIAQAGYQFLYYLNASDFKSREFYGYIAASTAKPGAYLLAIRGTKTFQEWLLDFLAVPVPFSPAPEAGSVALGFLSIYQTFTFVDTAGASHTLAEVIADLTAKAARITEFLVLGHSLGAALATLTAAELAIVNPSNVQDKVKIYTYASPRVGLPGFASSFNDAVYQLPHLEYSGHCTGVSDLPVHARQRVWRCDHPDGTATGDTGDYAWLRTQSGELPMVTGRD